ncbi:hypothetical protein HC256_003523 [Beauveria bassiana]|nr:hypothetical protein HC256_003523 [Beauveria bassiana]
MGESQGWGGEGAELRRVGGLQDGGEQMTDRGRMLRAMGSVDGGADDEEVRFEDEERETLAGHATARGS